MVTINLTIVNEKYYEIGGVSSFVSLAEALTNHGSLCASSMLMMIGKRLIGTVEALMNHELLNSSSTL